MARRIKKGQREYLAYLIFPLDFSEYIFLFHAHIVKGRGRIIGFFFFSLFSCGAWGDTKNMGEFEDFPFFSLLTYTLRYFIPCLRAAKLFLLPLADAKKYAGYSAKARIYSSILWPPQVGLCCTSENVLPEEKEIDGEGQGRKVGLDWCAYVRAYVRAREKERKFLKSD